MTWDIDLVLMLRVIINDLNSPQKNTDLYLQRILVTAGILMNNEIDLPFDYIFDISAVTIDPDPVIEGDTITQALLPLKAACVMNQADFRIAVGQGIRVRDGDSAIDTSVSFRGFRDIIEIGPCASYEKIRWKLQASGANAVGAVMSPFRGPNETRRIFETISWYYDNLSTTFSGCDNFRRG